MMGKKKKKTTLGWKGRGERLKESLKGKGGFRYAALLDPFFFSKKHDGRVKESQSDDEDGRRRASQVQWTEWERKEFHVIQTREFHATTNNTILSSLLLTVTFDLETFLWLLWLLWRWDFSQLFLFSSSSSTFGGMDNLTKTLWSHRSL